MGTVHLKFRNNTISLVADDEKRTIELADRFNHRVEGIAASSSSFVTDNKLAFIAGLILEDENDQLKKKLDLNNPEEIESKANKVFCEALDQVSTYLENLADRLEKK